MTINNLPQVLKNFMLLKFLSLARFELGLLASNENFSKFNQKYLQGTKLPKKNCIGKNCSWEELSGKGFTGKN
jgi:hypothetical protein